ncbi:MAG: class II glutamine amidotransferase, partial [Mycobacterium sp.]|nr:class II glutamine amidotransferase [Mycobacterium sp.]
QPAPEREFHLRTNRIRAWSRHLFARSSVVFASERMDDDPRWRLMEPGELVHVDEDLQIDRRVVLPDPPRHQLSKEDLSMPARQAQHATA